MARIDKVKRLIKAVKKNDFEGVKKTILSGANCNATTQIQTNGCGIYYRALSVACSHGYEDIVKFLLEAGADVNATTPYGEPPLISAVENNHMAIIRILLDHGADVNAVSNDTDTALHIAVSQGSLDAVGIIVDAGADLNAVNTYGETPLMYGAISGETEAMEMLIDAGADILIQDWRGDTAFDILREEYPEKYGEWVQRINKETLVHEDAVVIDSIGLGPDFSL